MTRRERIRRFFRRFLKPGTIREWTAIWRESGLVGLARKKGWRILVALFLFYLIRDSFLYLLLPWLIARGLIGG
jgi:hypothetical protein